MRSCLKVFLIALLAVFTAGCATSSNSRMGGMYSGYPVNAPLERIEPGMIVSYTYRDAPAPRQNMVLRTQPDGFYAGPAEGVGSHNADEPPLFIQYDQLSNIEFDYLLKNGEVRKEKAKMAVAVPFALGCVALGLCPIK